MTQQSLNSQEILRLVAYLVDVSGTRIFAQLISDPKRFIYLGPPEWEFNGFVDKDFVTGAILQHEYQPVSEELTFKYQEKKKFLSKLKLP